MSEQFIKAYAVDAAALHGLTGSGDGDVLKRAKRKRNLFEEITDLLEEWGDSLTIEEVLLEITSGGVTPKHAYEYRRVLQIVAEVLGTPLKPDEITLPGRGWHELGPAFALWGLERLATLWMTLFAWPAFSPAKTKTKAKVKAKSKAKAAGEVAWPRALLVERSSIAALEKELKSFDATRIAKRGVPKTVPRADEWTREELTEILTPFFATMITWLAKARPMKPRVDLLIWVDGQQ